MGAALPSLAQQSADNGHWVGTWGASPSDPLPGATAPSYTDQTVRQVGHVSIGGNYVRLRLSNTLSSKAVQIGAVHIALSAGNGMIVPETDMAVAFSGQPAVTTRTGRSSSAILSSSS